MNDFARLNEIYGNFFQPPFPARLCIAVTSLPKNALVEIEMIAEKTER
jgi:2-iminobutanoate/2-iminopropanoate deaminase